MKREQGAPGAVTAPARLVVPSREESPEELAVRAQAGSVEAFERLVVLFEARLFNFLLRRVRAAEAEDLAQETFIRAWERLYQYSPRWKFSTWLFTIATRQASSHLRRIRHTAPFEPLLAAAPSQEHGADMMRQETHARVWALVDDVLGDEQRTAVWLRYVEGMNPQDIARVLGKSKVAVRVMLHRARLALADALEQSGAAEDLGLPDPSAPSGESP